MKTEYIKQGKKRKYEYLTLLITDKKLKNWEISTIWGMHAPVLDISKNGSGISIMLRKTI